MSSQLLTKCCAPLTVLCQSAALSVENWRCNGLDTPANSEEWSGDDRIVITRTGAWSLSMQGRTTLATPASALYWPGQDSFRVRHPVPGGDQCTVLRLSPASRAAMRAAFLASAPAAPQHQAIAISGAAYLQHRRLFAYAQQTIVITDPIAIEEPAFALISEIRSAFCALESMRRPSSSVVSDTLDLIARDYLQAMSLATIAQDVGCSMFHLSRLFQRATGGSMYQMILRLRLRDALERVLDSHDSLTMIALDTGFASPSHFATAFRREYGCTPQAARLDPQFKG